MAKIRFGNIPLEAVNRTYIWMSSSQTCWSLFKRFLWWVDGFILEDNFKILNSHFFLFTVDLVQTQVKKSQFFLVFLIAGPFSLIYIQYENLINFGLVYWIIWAFGGQGAKNILQAYRRRIWPCNCKPAQFSFSLIQASYSMK